ncbi:ABC transporter ATP-binding protein [Chromobacterium subtsugae]|uniref:ABC transporter ATP-binding protein n=1 Tax=Chromobacterium subtsugae TaxID=251747 RepID=A0ABS7FH28_9NEIS|nr:MULTISPECIES: ABC transporter ATP-binding protein [Chromobacterium]KUM02445.1 ABC transporter ATP-binding protein [Chromobacterium subtsugae]KZE87375.1 ABC transporter ATP-binding protein [Chromobacterium sp. F49]MBW7568338.1 ABC transporter ATP-binding protein [Chromobacterium subtsugae]MBW8289398.1 ABC transporter ATP-binding protein [Chromobacterium subtsugae]WSE93288.1 ABC transporter ATP-binding protein [Chromobacterium subtsugae]
MLTLRNLNKRFGARVVADAVSLTVAAGETLALLGPSGCGKSTLLKMIAGLERPDGGGIHFDGEDLCRQPPERRGFALMFQDFALFPHLDALGNVMFGLIEQGCAKRDAAAQAREMLARVGLAEHGGRKVWTLSGGEQQRVALARALATRPRLLLLDEPFSSLDADLRRQLQQTFRALLREAGIPAIIVTHDRDEAFALADRVAVLKAGRLLQCDTPARLLAAPADAWLARFIGYDNVLADAAVPPGALLLGDDQPPARIVELIWLPDGARVKVVAAAGELVLNLSGREAARWQASLFVGGEIGVGVAEAGLLRFN